MKKILHLGYFQSVPKSGRLTIPLEKLKNVNINRKKKFIEIIIRDIDVIEDKNNRMVIDMLK